MSDRRIRLRHSRRCAPPRAECGCHSYEAAFYDRLSGRKIRVTFQTNEEAVEWLGIMDEWGRGRGWLEWLALVLEREIRQAYEHRGDPSPELLSVLAAANAAIREMANQATPEIVLGATPGG